MVLLTFWQSLHKVIHMFIAYNKIRMHDTDMAGILYFPRQFRFVHDAWEDLMEKEGMNFDTLFTKTPYAFVVVHAEADYKAPLRVGDSLEVHVKTLHIGQTSFSIGYQIYKEDKTLVGTAKTVHVTIDRNSWQKIPIPNQLLDSLKKYV